MYRFQVVIAIIALALVPPFLGGCANAGDKNEAAKTGEAEKSAPVELASNESTSGELQVAGDFTLKDMNGKTVRLSDYLGQVVILDFWATWCPPCVKEIPHFNELARDYKELGLAVVGVSVDRGGKADVEKFIANKMKIDYPVLLSEEPTYNQYQQYLPADSRGGIPFTFVIDREGKIREHYVGYRPKEVFIAAIEPLLGSSK